MMINVCFSGVFFFQKEKKILETKRLDLDACKSRLRKAKSATSQSQVCPTNVSILLFPCLVIFLKFYFFINALLG